MKSAEEYYNEFIKLEGTNKSDFILLINEARKEAIKECAKKAKSRIILDEESILSLIDELK